MEDVENYLVSLAESVYAEETDPVQAIRTHIKAFLNACEENPSYIKVWLEWSASVREETWPSYLEFQNRLLDMIAKQVDKGVKQGLMESGLAPKERARWALGNAQMLVSMVFDPNGKPRGMEKMVERGFDHMLGVKG